MSSDKCCLLKHSLNTSSKSRMTKSSVLHRNIKGWSAKHNHFTHFCFHYLQVTFYIVSHLAHRHPQIADNKHVLHTGLCDLLHVLASHILSFYTNSWFPSLGCWNLSGFPFPWTINSLAQILTKLCVGQLTDNMIQVLFILSSFSTQPSILKLGFLLTEV